MVDTDFRAIFPAYYLTPGVELACVGEDTPCSIGGRGEVGGGAAFKFHKERGGYTELRPQIFGAASGQTALNDRPLSASLGVRITLVADQVALSLIGEERYDFTGTEWTHTNFLGAGFGIKNPWSSWNLDYKFNPMDLGNFSLGISRSFYFRRF